MKMRQRIGYGGSGFFAMGGGIGREEWRCQQKNVDAVGTELGTLIAQARGEPQRGEPG